MPHPIFALILCGNLVEVATLIRINPEAVRVQHSRWYNATPLVYASNKGRVKICKHLLDNGASVNEVSDWKNTALHSSCQFGHLELTKLLLQHGASVHKVNKHNQTPLHLAIQYGHKDILRRKDERYIFISLCCMIFYSSIFHSFLFRCIIILLSHGTSVFDT